MKLFVTIYNDATLLGNFLHHYTVAGVTEFFIALPRTFLPVATPFKDLYRITLVVGLEPAASTNGANLALGPGGTAPILQHDHLDEAMATVVSNMRRSYQGPEEWVLIVDLDEFIEFPRSIASITGAADRMGANVVRGIMIDRFARDGQPVTLTSHSNLSSLFPVKSRFTHEVMGGSDHKGVLVKGHLIPTAGVAHHRFDNEWPATERLEISHYKWIAGVLDRLKVSWLQVRSAGIKWAPHYERALRHYRANGRFAWETFGGASEEEFALGQLPLCAMCNGAIDEAEAEYSTSHFGQTLCRGHQDKHRQQHESNPLSNSCD
jgi:hypothetical protein